MRRIERGLTPAEILVEEINEKFKLLCCEDASSEPCSKCGNCSEEGLIKPSEKQ